MCGVHRGTSVFVQDRPTEGVWGCWIASVLISTQYELLARKFPTVTGYVRFLTVSMCLPTIDTGKVLLLYKSFLNIHGLYGDVNVSSSQRIPFLSPWKHHFPNKQTHRHHNLLDEHPAPVQSLLILNSQPSCHFICS